MLVNKTPALIPEPLILHGYVNGAIGTLIVMERCGPCPKCMMAHLLFVNVNGRTICVHCAQRKANYQ